MSRAMLLLCALAACDPRLYAKEKPKPAEPQKADKDKDDDDEPSSPASPFGALSLLGGSHRPGPFDEPKEAGAEGEHAAMLELDGTVTELDMPFSFSLFGNGVGTAIPLRKLVGRLHELDGDKNVTTILLRVRGLGMSAATAEEVGTILGTLTKPVSCHFEEAENLTYLVLSRCRDLSVAPTGGVSVNGPSLTPIYLKGLLDLLGVQADFIHIGAYKGAAEPLTRTEPSPEMRQTYSDLLDGVYARLIANIAEGRHVAADKVVAWIDQAIFLAEEAKAAGLVDEVETYEAWRDRKSKGVWKRLDIEEKQGAGDLFALLGSKPRKKVRGPHVALLYAVGEVKDGKGSPLGAFEEITSGRLVPALRAATANEDVKAIVLRVDSPGGSALASELIWHAVHDAVAKKPVIVSMGSLAASGGYYISCGATRIFATPDTITGSIGVVGGKLVYAAGLGKIGITGAEMGRGKRALIASPLRRWNEDERKLIQQMMESIYRTFKQRVADGRKLALDEVEKNAQGRVWTGDEAKKRGLVDELGTLEDALAHARKAVGLTEESPVSVYPPEPTLMDIIASLGGGDSRIVLLQPALAGLSLLDAPRRRALVRALDTALRFAGEHVRTVAIVPEIR